MSLVATILGCGSSAGVPRVAAGWGACDPSNPKNRRRRCSLLVEREGADGRTTVLVDTSPDLREQLIDQQVSWVDGILMTHDHADHTHGVDDIRPIVIHNRRRVAMHMTIEVERLMRDRFGYCFETPEGSQYPPILDACRIEPAEPLVVSGAGGEIVARPYEQEHGETMALGFRFGGLAYSPDVSDIPVNSLPVLEGLDIWIIDALRYTRHPSHFNVDEALYWIERIRPKRAVLTNMHVDLDYEELRARLPSNVTPAYDGMQIEIPA